jgi:RNA polymerase sigma factor (sigma-70 family)
MNDDADLLLRYVREGAEDAFAALVRRHLALVYQTALRQLGGNTHLAQEAAQDVFIAMGRKAAELAQRQTLTGWLYISTCFAARKLMRAAQRRQHWEQDSVTMHTAHEPEWSRIRPELDGLMLRLAPAEREALLLRFFEGMRFGEMAEKLRITEDGARLRVDRAVEKLRQLLARRGITSTGAALATALMAHASAPAPLGLAATVSSAALTSLAAPSGAVALGGLLFMSKSIFATVAIAGLVGAGAAYLIHRTHAPAANIAVTSPAVATVTSPASKRLDALRAVKTKPSGVAIKVAPPASTERDRAGADPKAQVWANLEQGFFQLEALTDVGSATPRAAVETFRWALDRGTLDDVAGLIRLGPDDKRDIEAVLATLPPEARSQYPDAEHVLALYGARDASVVYPTAGVVQIVSERVEPTDAQASKAHVTLQFDQGIRGQLDQQNHEDFDLQQTNAGWRIVVPSFAVKHVIRWLTEPDAAAKAGP